VLIETEVAKTKNVMAALQDEKLKEIKSIDLVTGPYDIIAVLEHDDFNTIGDLVTDKIHPVSGVRRTATCLSIRIQ
jgi:DNA-binding Lrp family transcriptional regulator